MTFCKHCGLEIECQPGGCVHAEGRQRRLMRCWPEDSGLPYGYNAETPDEPCTEICLGSVNTR